ncbi:MAG: M23 family metallopeptidase [Polyangiaceae bacterium]
MLARPVLLAAAGVAALVAGSAGSPSAWQAGAGPARRGAGTTVLAMTCEPGTVADGTICVHVPDEGAPESPSAEMGHHDRRGAWNVYEQIPRRPDRPADYEAYRFPVPGALPGGKHVVSGYDLDRPDESQRRGRHLRAVGHGGLDIPDPRGTPVRALALEAQSGDAEVVYVGALFGTTVVTRQTIREGGRLRDYLVLFGHLDRAAPGLAAGTRLKEDDVLGFVGDTGSPELVHLHLETRRVRDGVDVAKVSPAQLLDGSVSVVCDPRNVLPRKP